ncbi:MAG: iron dicitrate transport regulator FecR [Planctomycetes bacterium]|nr:iron dicitrate transport regulator FecR [Planctomycetota bacterium]
MDEDDDLARALDLVAARLAGARRLLVGTGAGMSADSGVPTYRAPGQRGWRDYGVTDGQRPEDLACPQALEERPAEAWAFLERRRREVSAAEPHAGYAALHRLAARTEAFVQTTNVDGLHLRAGWPAARLHEVHGSLWRLQCAGPCSRRVWDEPRVPLCALDDVGVRALDRPRCPDCGRPARPHALLFADLDYVGAPAAEEARRAFHAAGPDVVLVVGESGVIPTHLHDAATLRRERGAFVVNVNPAPPPTGTLGPDVHLPLPARDAMVRLAEQVFGGGGG